MKNIVLKVENLSKQYRLGQVGTGTLSHDLTRWWYKMRGQEDPFLKVGEVNDRSQKASSEYVWAIRDVNFEVFEGEVLGIIGKNGAGKSTLLKILSQVTSPTLGEIKIRGRIASLLEVGTGFHPELTGRENVFLNGAILGMTKTEIKRKFDEIVDFSGVEKYIDTPVKRYSSGMYVRLAFAVAAHLEPEILIVDEVLAVGDFEFQKKCLGKMKDVSGQGRTVLFVSHDMDAVSRLCTRGIYLHQGTVKFSGNVQDTIRTYFESVFDIMGKIPIKDRKDRKGNGLYRYEEVWFTRREGEKVTFFKSGDQMNIHLKIKGHGETNGSGEYVYPSVVIYDSKGQRLISLASGLNNNKVQVKDGSEVKITVEKLSLAPGKYICNLHLDKDPKSIEIIDKVEAAFKLEVEEGDYHGFGVVHGAGQDMFFSDFKVVSLNS